MSSAREDVWCEAWDPPRVSWQTDSLYHVESARRALKESRQRLEAALAWHRRYEDEARARAIALKLAQEERKAYWASPEGIAETARREAERALERQKEHAEDMARRKYRLPVWAEWAAWRVVERETHAAVGEKLGGVGGSVVSRALMDYVYLNHPGVTAEWHGSCPLDSGQRRRWLKRHFRDRSEPLFPGRVVRIEEAPQGYPRTREEYKQRNEWVYRQHLGGRTLQQIAADIGLSGTRVNQICHTQAEIDRKRQENWPKPKPWRASTNRGRPIDMGGVRNVWLHYGVAVDPRLDARELG